MKIGVAKKILEYLQGKDFVYAGTIEKYIYQEFGPKGSTANRRMQELAQKGKIEVKKDSFGNTIIPKQYRIVFTGLGTREEKIVGEKIAEGLFQSLPRPVENNAYRLK